MLYQYYKSSHKLLDCHQIIPIAVNILRKFKSLFQNYYYTSTEF